ncbi:MAG: TolC family protein [Gammaproteobacteria bacterium]|nr:TolC family protein [Gammaproteobacteria bacterium]
MTRSLLGAAALLLSACAATPVPDLAPTDVPDGWQGPVTTEATVWPERNWWDRFGDTELSTLIEQVRANNLDLANNRRNLRAAQLTLREAGFNLLPTPVLSISTGATYGVTRNNGVTIESGPNTPTRANFSLSYNDILSKPLTYERATADYDARIAQLMDLSLNTLGTASSTYFQLLLTRDKIAAAQQNVANAEAIGAIAQARVNAGVAVPIEALQQQIAIQRERANLSSLRQSELSARASLALLLGRGVQDFDVSGQTLTTMTVPTVQPGLPAELLLRRPSLVQAEANLRGATASVDVSRLKLLPQISLTGSAGASSTKLLDFVSTPTLLADVSASLAQTLLDNGQRLRNIEQARIQLENSLSSYRKAVLAAFNEIEVLLRNIQLLEQLGHVAAENLNAAEESFRIAQARYREGVIDYQSVLNAQNTLFSTRNSYLDNKLQRLNAMISLYQALGGGWQAGTEPGI